MKQYKLFFLFFLTLISGCTTTQADRTMAMANTATKPATPQQAKQLLSTKPEYTAVYLFVPALRTDNALAEALNGFRGKLKVVDMISGETIAILPTKNGIKMDLLPYQTYQFKMGEYWEKAGYGENNDWAMELEIDTQTLGVDSFKAFDVYTDSVHIEKADIKRLSTEETLKRLSEYTIQPTRMAMDKLAYSSVETQALFEACLSQSQLALCESSMAKVPNSHVPPNVSAHIAHLQADAAQKKALADMEASLPVEVRRDKYMVQLSQYLKQQKYTEALPLFSKLDALPGKTDPSLKFFYGEALLKTGKPAQAMTQLYDYIREQGNSAPHYARALELINQAEASL